MATSIQKQTTETFQVSVKQIISSNDPNAVTRSGYCSLQNSHQMTSVAYHNSQSLSKFVFEHFVFLKIAMRSLVEPTNTRGISSFYISDHQEMLFLPFVDNFFSQNYHMFLFSRSLFVFIRPITMPNSSNLLVIYSSMEI